jgi:glyoxylase-like metal-dependent hydrolase (beta-lactamase superfamily II)
MALELKNISNQTYYIPSMSCVGCYIHPGTNEITLIDSGNNKSMGQQIYKLLEKQGMKITNIINTHFHADHTGGNAYLQRKTGCRIYAHSMEKPFIENPELEPSILFGGYPYKQIKNSFLMAKPSIVNKLSEIQTTDNKLKFYNLPGHSFNMVGIETADDVFFLGDSLFPEQVINKYHIFVLWDVSKQLQTFDYLDTLDYTYYVMSHGGLKDDIKSLVEMNRNKINEITSVILSLLEQPFTTDEITEAIFRHYQLKLDGNQSVLIKFTISNYLSYLLDVGKITLQYENYRTTWIKGD